MSQAVDQAALEQFMGQLIGTMTGGMMCFSILLGDELGLYRLMAEAGPMTAEDLAGKAGCNSRWCRSGSTARRPTGSSTGSATTAATN